MSARPLRYFFPYYAISTAYNSPIMHNERLAQRRALKWRHSAKNTNNVREIKWRRYVNVVGSNKHFVNKTQDFTVVN